MTDVIFARPRHEYHPYVDLWRLVQVSGYPLVYLDEMDVADASKTYILTPINGEWNGGWQEAKARIIFWQLERQIAPEPLPPGVAEMWVSDRWQAERTGAKYVQLGSHTRLNPTPERCEPKTIDVAWFAYTFGRRGDILEGLKARELTVAPNSWGIERHESLLRSRCMVYAHQEADKPMIAPLRWALAAAYKLPMMSEVSQSSCAYTFEAQYSVLADSVKMWLSRGDDALAKDALAFHDLMCVEWPFARRVQEALR